MYRGFRMLALCVVGLKDINKKAEEYHMIQEYMTSKEFLDIQKRLEKILPSVFEAINYYEDA